MKHHEASTTTDEEWTETTTDTTAYNETNKERDHKEYDSEGMPSWNTFMKLRDHEYGWCYFNYHFLPCVVGKCLWVSSIQRRTTVRSLATPSDEAFCLLVLRNGWESWVWECNNHDATKEERVRDRPGGKYTSKGCGRNTCGHGGWNQIGITLYNKLVSELTKSRTELDKEKVQQDDGTFKSKMDLLEMKFLDWARSWDYKNVLKLSGVAKCDKKRRKENNFVNAVNIFGWKDGDAQ